MRVLVTGSSGFIGTYLCGYFAAKGHDVVGVDKSAAPETQVICDILDGPLLVIVEDERLAIDVGDLRERRSDGPLRLRLGHLIVRRRRVGHVVDVADGLALGLLARVARTIARTDSTPLRCPSTRGR